MKYISLILICFIRIDVNSQESYNYYYEQTLPTTSYWESPSGESYLASEITVLDELGTWTYYSVDSEGNISIGFERDVTCLCQTVSEDCFPEIIQLTPCDITYYLDDECNQFTPYWEDPNGTIHTNKSLDNVTVNGYWKLYMDAECEGAIDSIYLDLCEIPLTEELCNTINTDVDGTADWFGSYVVQGNGNLYLEFDAQSNPDKLIVIINNNEVVNTGNYSSNLCTTTLSQCIGTVVPGCGNNYIADLPISFGDVIDITVYGAVCNSSYTYWALIAECNEVQNRSRKVIPDDVITCASYFPNPVTEILNVKFGVVLPYRLSGFNLQGQKVFDIEVTKDNYSINTNNLSSGVYTINAYFANYVDTQMISVSH